MHILVIGQSNVANHVSAKCSSSFGSVTDANGILQPLTDPLPGGSGTRGSVWTRLGILLNGVETVNEYVVTLRAVGGTSISDWSEGGAQYSSLALELQKISLFLPPITHVVWQQGEKDTLLNTKCENYISHFGALFDLVSKHLPESRWIICRSSYRMGHVSNDVINAQNSIIQNFEAFAGPNTDLLGDRFRCDGTHFNEKGATRFAELLAQTILAI